FSVRSTTPYPGRSVWRPLPVVRRRKHRFCVRSRWRLIDWRDSSTLVTTARKKLFGVRVALRQAERRRRSLTSKDEKARALGRAVTWLRYVRQPDASTDQAMCGG